MNYIVTEKQRTLLKIGIIWNGIVGAISPFVLTYGKYYDGYSGTECLIFLFVTALLVYPVLAVNIYAYLKVIEKPTKSIINLGFGFSIIGLFFLNPIASIITIVGYVRIKQFNKNRVVSDQQPVDEINQEQIDEEQSNFFDL